MNLSYGNFRLFRSDARLFEAARLPRGPLLSPGRQQYSAVRRCSTKSVSVHADLQVRVSVLGPWSIRDWSAANPEDVVMSYEEQRQLHCRTIACYPNNFVNESTSATYT